MTGKELVPVTRRVTAADMAWMAAVIDLKGAVVRKNNKMRRTRQIVLYISTKDKRIAQRLSALTGTAPEPHEKPLAESFARRGCAEHCPHPHVHVHEQYPWNMPKTTRWALSGVAAAVVLVNLAPYMSTYADYVGDVAEIAVSFAARGQGSGATRAAVTRLEQLGWKIPPQISRRMAEATESK